MSELTRIEKIKALKDNIILAFAAFDTGGTPPVETPVAAAEGYTGKLKTGEDVAAMPTLENGGSLSIVGAEGSLPAPDGSYELEDGGTLDVVSGVIANLVTSAPVPEEAPSAEEMAMKAEIETLKEANTALKSQIETVKADFETKLSAIETKLSAQHNLTVALNDGLVELMETPAVSPTQAPTTESVQLSTSAEDWRKQAQIKQKNSAKIKL